MRTIKELLVILFNFIRDNEIEFVGQDGLPLARCEMSIGQYHRFEESGKKLFNGMCNSIDHLIQSDMINEEEHYRLNKFLIDNRPDDVSPTYWWIPVVRQPRLNWIDLMIKEIK